MLEALFGLCRKSVENEPLKIFMALSDVERNRAERRSKPPRSTGWRASTRRWTRNIRCLPKSPRSPTRPSFNSSTRRTPSIRSAIRLLASDAAGTMQALVGLWQIFLRQRLHFAPRMRPTLAAHSDAVSENEERARGVRLRPRGREAAAGRDAFVRRGLRAGSHDRSAGRRRPRPTSPTRTPADRRRHDPDLRGAAAGVAFDAVRSGG